MKIRVLYFASLRERAGASSSDEELEPGATVGTLWGRLAGREAFAGAARPGFSVNGAWCAPTVVLQDGDEVGLLPPVSGG